jgi:hypothetical protein
MPVPTETTWHACPLGLGLSLRQEVLMRHMGPQPWLLLTGRREQLLLRL